MMIVLSFATNIAFAVAQSVNVDVLTGVSRFLEFPRHT